MLNPSTSEQFCTAMKPERSYNRAQAMFIEPIRARRSRILAAIEAMAPLAHKHRQRLELVTRAFIDSGELFADAVRHGWTDRELFAVDPVCAADRPDRAGLVSGVALSALNRPKVLAIASDHAVIECGTVDHRSLLTHRRCSEQFLGVLWWQCSELGGGRATMMEAA